MYIYIYISIDTALQKRCRCWKTHQFMTIMIPQHCAQELAGITDPINQPIVSREDDDTEPQTDITLLTNPTWQSLPTDGAQSEKEIASRALAKEQLEKLIARLTEEQRQVVMECEKDARKMVRAKVTLLVESDRKQEMLDDLKAALVRAGIQANQGPEVLVVYDQEDSRGANHKPSH